ncbi:uncharacterized protein LOC129720967 [Wyeomyia smithii]|uniref:uncharacterized protein LOC129720967 n=1 Tax=Wyeomyia smithii TaxID=174621 RepID=UPI002467C679|nr:uncharacterized protein LOC129720967 [Wyeomyia smithii]
MTHHCFHAQPYMGSEFQAFSRTSRTVVLISSSSCVAPRMTLDKVLITIVLAASLAGAAKSPALRIMQQIANECRSVTGSDEAFNQLRRVVEQDTLKCFDDHVSAIILQSSSLLNNQPLKPKEICEQSQNLFSCIEPIINKLEPYVNDPIRNAVEKLQKIVDTLPEVSSLICNNSAVKQRQSLELKQ